MAAAQDALEREFLRLLDDEDKREAREDVLSYARLQARVYPRPRSPR